MLSLAISSLAASIMIWVWVASPYLSWIIDLTIPTTSRRYEIFWSQFKLLSDTTCWINFTIATWSAFWIKLYTVSKDGSWVKKSSAFLSKRAPSDKVESAALGEEEGSGEASLVCSVIVWPRRLEVVCVWIYAAETRSDSVPWLLAGSPLLEEDVESANPKFRLTSEFPEPPEVPIELVLELVVAVFWAKFWVFMEAMTGWGK